VASGDPLDGRHVTVGNAALVADLLERLGVLLGRPFAVSDSGGEEDAFGLDVRTEAVEGVVLNVRNELPRRDFGGLQILARGPQIALGEDPAPRSRRLSPRGRCLRT
jgi:hypothetical protein